MNFKKIIAMVCSFALCAAVLTACSSNNADSAETTTAADTTVSEEVTSEEAVESETEAETEESIEEVPAETEETEESADEGAEEEAPVEDGEVALNPLQPAADAATATGEWPELMEVTDEMMLKDFFLLDPANENYTNMLVLQCPMSAVMTEIIIIEAVDVDAAKADLEARQKKAQDQDAFYPNDVEIAGASIVGTEGNYAYFILAQGAADAEPALVEALKAL